MKKMLAVFLVLAVCALPLAGLSEGFSADEFRGQTLNVNNWGEYVDMDTIRAFEQEYGVRVNYKTFESNEALWTQMMADEPWDVVFPSDYMVERLIAANKLQPLDQSIVNNLDGLVPELRTLPYDEGNVYSVPYFWQTIGIIYDKTKVSAEDMEAQGWDALRNPEYAGHIYMYDSSRDAFMVAEKALGYSMNTTDEKEILEAAEWLKQMHSTMDPSYVTDVGIDGMINGLKWLSVDYSGNAVTIHQENEDMEYCTPYQGTNIAVDAMVIPASAQNPKLANVFIRYMSTAEASRANSLEVGYASPVQSVLDELSGPGGDFEESLAYVPRAGYELDEMYKDLPAYWQSEQPSMWATIMAQ